MKRKYGIICVILITLITACGTDVKTMDSEENINSIVCSDETQLSEQDFSKMQQVLLNKTEFYGTIEANSREYGWHKVDELTGLWGEMEDQFGIVDFDHDGIEEVFVYYNSGDAIIFHEEDGVVYGYASTYNGLKNVCTNGTFEGTLGATDNDWCANVSFNKSEMRYEYVNIVTDYNAQTSTYTYGISIKSEEQWCVEDEKVITEKEFDEMRLRYPSGESVEIHTYISDGILEFVSSSESSHVNEQIQWDDNELLLDWNQLTIDSEDEIEVVYDGEKMLSFTIDRLYMAEGAAHPGSRFYGLTIDKTSGAIVHLKEYIPNLQTLIQIVESGQYEVPYGEYKILSKEKIIEHLNKIFSQDEWDTYYLNFYVDEDHVYVIAKDTYGYYSILKIDNSIL